MSETPDVAVAMAVPTAAEFEQEVIRILRDHLMALPPRTADEDDLRLVAESITQEARLVFGVSGEDCRRLMQEVIDSQKPLWLEEVARSTDERLERTAQLVRSAERALERARISNGAECLKVTLFRPGNGPAQGMALEVVPLAGLLNLIGADGG